MRFSLRDLFLVVAATSVLLFFLSALLPTSLLLIYALPIVGGMVGLLLKGHVGGAVGAVVGAFIVLGVKLTFGV